MTHGDDPVLVAVLKNPPDLALLLQQRWYRIPEAFVPKQPFTLIAFYQPVIFQASGKQIRYYAAVAGREKARRIELLPDEPNHPRAQDRYVKFRFDEVRALDHPVRNIIPRRVTFGFTSLARLTTAAHLLELYGVPATEQIIAQGLAQMGIPLSTEYPIGYSGGRFRIDLAIACRNGWLAIECDNAKAHQGAAQQQKDQRKDRILGYHGWRVIRLKETDILQQYERTLARLQVAIASLGGLANP